MCSVEKWGKYIGEPRNYKYAKTLDLLEVHECQGCSCELYKQANGVRPNGEVTYQRVMMVIPKTAEVPMPAVVVPFYYPEAAMGIDPSNGEIIEKFQENPMVMELAHRGYIVISADSYHLTYADVELDREAFERWEMVSAIFNNDQPQWSGVGKLIADTKLIIDIVANDSRVDSDRIGIMGHSLGGKMAFYTGCLDSRIKVIVASDFGIGWDMTNWDMPWYWGNKLEDMKKEGMKNTDLLKCVAPKPFCLIAGESDGDDSRAMLYELEEYKENPKNLLVIDHRSGHRPPKYAREAGYSFLDFWLSVKE